MSKKSIGNTEFAVLVRHVRQMISTPDPLSILVRGMILIDNVLESLIDQFSAISFQKLDETFHHMTLTEKAYVACSLGAMSQGELACIKEINRRRNEIAHRLDANVVQRDEEHIVRVFAGQTKLFSGMNYYPDEFPKTLIFILLVLFYFLHMRVGNDSQKRKHVRDETNVDAIGAITMTQTMIEVVNSHLDSNDEDILAIVKRHADEAKRMRDEQLGHTPAP